MLYWGAWAGLANWPYKIDPKTAFSAYTEIAAKLNWPIHSSLDVQRGFPFNYSSFIFDSSQILAETFSLNALIFNCFLTGIALASIVILGQSFKYFSNFHLLAIAAGIALILGIYTSIKPGYPVNYLCKVAIFVSPPAILVVTTIIRKMQNKKLQPSARSTVVTRFESPTRTGSILTFVPLGTIMQFRTKHLFVLTTLIAVLLVFVLPIIRRAPQTYHQQLCEDLGIDEPDKTQQIAYSAFEDASGAYHSYFLMHSESEGRYILRHTFHTPRRLWWLQNWFPLNTNTLKALGYDDILVNEQQTFDSKPTQGDFDAFVATLKPVLKNRPISFVK